MNKRYSGKRIMVWIFFTMVAVTLICLLICGGYSLYSSQQELVYCNEAAMDVFFDGMGYTISDLEQFCKNIYSQDNGVMVLSLDPNLVTEDQSLLAWNSIRLLVRSCVTANTAVMVFDDRTDKKFYCYGEKFQRAAVSLETVENMEHVRRYWSGQINPEMNGWRVMKFHEPEEAVILMHARRYRNMYICAMVNITAYSRGFSNREHSPITYAFLTPDQILTNADYAAQHNITLEQMLKANDKKLHINGLDYILQTRFDEQSGLGLCSIISTNSMWGNWWVYVSLLLTALTVVCISFWAIYVSVEKIMFVPLQKIREASQQITEGVQSLQKEPERISEFAQIQDALDALVTQKVTLETEKMRQESEKEHAMLQYYQLQTRSHFLLNCLKSLYNLTARGEQDTTMQIITRFSNHIRYIFHDSLTFVTVREELAEVEDYFQIVNLERVDHILLNKNIDPDLMEYPIPPLLIQTFLENFQKHNPQTGKLLHFTIRIDRVELENVQYVRVRMTDNGIGYSEEALQQLQDMDGVFAQFHVGIQNLCRRIEILYKKQHKTAFYNLPKGGACSVFYLPDLADEENHSPKEDSTNECTVCG